MKILITGFDPFGGEKINPAYEAVKDMPSEIKGVEIIKREIPTVFNKSIDILDKLIEENSPEWVICVGQAGGRDKISIEKVSINYDHARIKDNEGNQPFDRPIVEGGETAYFSSLPIKETFKKWIENNIPGEISYTAGTFVCNHIFYGLSYLINTKYKSVKGGGFIHVPFLPEQTLDKKNTPYMTKEMMTNALVLAIEAIIENPTDRTDLLGGGNIA